MAITSILDLQLKPDAVEEGLAVIHRVLGETRAFEGCLGVTVIQDSADPAHVLAIEEWESLERDAAYREWRAGDGAAPELAEVITAPPGLVVCKPLADI